MLKVRNFEKFQHYRDRAPIWIKLYRSLLRDYQFCQLPDAARSHLMLIWLFASEVDNKIPNDPDWVRRQINSTEPVDLGLLIRSGFLIDLDSTVAQTMLQNGANHASTDSKTTLADASTEQSRAEAEERESRERAEAAAEQSRGRAEAEAAGALPALPAAAANGFKEIHKSGFAFAEIEDFICSTKPWISNPGGLARKLWRSGEEDTAIEQWRNPRKEPEERWPKWVFDSGEPGTVEEKKRRCLQMRENQRQLEAEAEFNQQAADEAA